MAELIAKSPCDGLLPRTIGSCTLEEVDLGVLTSVAPYNGVADPLMDTHGMAFPAPNRATGTDGARAIWFGRGVALLAGPAPDAGLAAQAAVTDQSDAWACVTLSGPGSEDVLARLVPVDVRAATFQIGHTMRTQLQHINVSITRTEAETFLILGFRAMAATLVHDLVEALESVAARG